MKQIFALSDEFITVWRVEAGDLAVCLPLHGDVKCRIDWGDGSVQDVYAPLSVRGRWVCWLVACRVTNMGFHDVLGHDLHVDAACCWALDLSQCWCVTGHHHVTSLLCRRSDAKAATHTYATPGEYEVAVTGEMGHFGFGDGRGGDRLKLVNIRQWGCAELGQVGYQFKGCRNLGHVNARDVPDLSAVTNMERMFYGASSFQSDLSGWNVSAVTDMDAMFYGASFQDAERPRFQ